MRIGSGVQSAPEVFGKRQNNSKTSAVGNEEFSQTSVKVYLKTDDMLFSGGNGTGLSFYIKYAEESTEDNPVVIAKGVDENGKEFEEKINITFPLMLPSIIVNIFLSISGAFKTFEIPYLMTRGGPGDSTNLIAYNIYKEAYLSNHAGYASAKAVVLCVIVMCIAIFQIRAMKRKEVEA